jgi:uncharacterized protein (DUF433 family)
MKLPEFLTAAPLGEIRLTGHRIGLYHVIEDYQRGYSPERLHEEFPTLPVELIDRVLAFYRDNRREVDDYLARCRRQSEENRQAARALDVEELQRRRQGL